MSRSKAHKFSVGDHVIRNTSISKEVGVILKVDRQAWGDYFVGFPSCQSWFFETELITSDMLETKQQSS